MGKNTLDMEKNAVFAPFDLKCVGGSVVIAGNSLQTNDHTGIKQLLEGNFEMPKICPSFGKTGLRRIGILRKPLLI